MAKRTIAVFTATRAEYGVLLHLMRAIADDPTLALRLIVSGTHLDTRFGRTEDSIIADGFHPDARIPLDLASDDPASIARAFGALAGGMAEALRAIAPDFLVLAGDRYEILAAAAAATLAGIPVAHLHGGEITEGAIDNDIRHAVTKLAFLHLVAAEPYRARVIQMGEEPDRVFTVGAPGIDSIMQAPTMRRVEFAEALGIAIDDPFILVTYHPVTRMADGGIAGARALLSALDRFPDRKVVVTGVNADPGRDVIAQLLHDFVMLRKGRAILKPNLGQTLYANALRHCQMVAGNSSSGLIEAPVLGAPTVNIGPRQSGRLRGPSVIDCAEDADAIAAAIDRAADPSFRAHANAFASPYGGPGASKRIKDVLKSAPPARGAAKRFHDLALSA